MSRARQKTPVRARARDSWLAYCATRALDSVGRPCKALGPNECHSKPVTRMSTKYELKNLATGKTAEIDALSGTIGPDALDISHLIRDLGVFTYDPGFMATASTESKITYIDGDAGVLLYRGYPVEQLAEKSSFLEVANLLINGTLPTKAQLNAFHTSIMRHTMVNEQLLRFFEGFHHDAHPMAMVSAVVASMAAFYHDTTDINNPRHREIFAHRIIAKLPTIAAAAYKHTLGQPFIYPRNDLRYCANMLNMFFAVPCEPYAIDPVAAEALDLLVHPARRPRAEREHLDGAARGKHGRQPLCSDFGGRLRALGAGSRRCQRGGAQHAR